MRELLLIAAVVAMFGFGYYLMNRLDCFLERQRWSQGLQPQPYDNSLRIGVSDPMVVDSITEILEEQSRQSSAVAVSLFHGSDKELLEELSGGKLDVIFLANQAKIPPDVSFHVRKVQLEHEPVMTRYSGLPIEPIAKEGAVQKMVWSKAVQPPSVRLFLEGVQPWHGEQWKNKRDVL